MWVPLLRVMPGEYEVIALNDEDKHVYTRLDNDCMLNGLHSALQRYHSAEGVNEEDRSLAARALKEYGNLRMALQALCHFAAGLYYIGYGRRGGKAGWRYADYASSRQGGAVACTCCGYTLWLYG